MKKYEWILLSGLGISQLGNWLYLIALNVMVWQLTHSPAAVAGIYLIGPIVRIVCGSFAGSYIDRWSKRTIVISADWIRGVLVCLVPFAHDLWLIWTAKCCIELFRPEQYIFNYDTCSNGAETIV